MSHEPLRKLLLVNMLGGAAIGILFVIGLLWVNAYGLRDLMLRDADGLLAFLMLCGGFVVTAASVVAGSAIMLNRGNSDDDDDRGGPGIRELVPIRVRARR